MKLKEEIVKRVQKDVKFIEDKVLATIPEKDNSDRLVRISEFVPNIAFAHPHYIKRLGAKAVRQARMARVEVAKKLSLAQSLLPKGHRLVVRSCYRCLATQKKAYDATYTRIKKTHPELSEEQIREKVSRFVAPLYITPPHSTGGAVDISIIGPDGRMLRTHPKTLFNTIIEQAK